MIYFGSLQSHHPKGGRTEATEAGSFSLMTSDRPQSRLFWGEEYSNLKIIK